jgi:hypothetical protein
VAPGSLFIDPDTHPAYETLGPLCGSGERGIDEISGDPDDPLRNGGNHVGFGPALLLFLLDLISQTFVLTQVLLKKQQQG